MNTDNQMWTEEIKSENTLLSINFRELWHYRDLLLMFLKNEFVTFYKQTILGPLWFFIQPVLTSLIYVILFGQIAKLSTDGTPQFAFYLAGITMWNYLSESLLKTSTVFQVNATLLGKVYFPRLIMPLSIVFSNLIKFGIQFLLFVIVIVYYAYFKNSIHPNLWVLATPFLVLLMALFALGLGMIFSSLTTKYKDLSFLLTFGIQLSMYATPVIYPVSTMPKKYLWIVNANPLSSIFECFRYGYLGAGEFDPSTLIYTTLFTIVLLASGTIIFNKVEKSFMDTV